MHDRAVRAGLQGSRQSVVRMNKTQDLHRMFLQLWSTNYAWFLLCSASPSIRLSQSIRLAQSIRSRFATLSQDCGCIDVRKPDLPQDLICMCQSSHPRIFHWPACCPRGCTTWHHGALVCHPEDYRDCWHELKPLCLAGGAKKGSREAAETQAAEGQPQAQGLHAAQEYPGLRPLGATMQLPPSCVKWSCCPCFILISSPISPSQLPGVYARMLLCP